MNEQPTHTTQYRAMLLRFSRDPAANAWRFTVRDVHTSRQMTFATPDELVAYLSTTLTNLTEIEQ